MSLKEKFAEGHIKPCVKRCRIQNHADIVTKFKHDTSGDSDTLCVLGRDENERT